MRLLNRIRVCEADVRPDETQTFSVCPWRLSFSEYGQNDCEDRRQYPPLIYRNEEADISGRALRM